MKLQPGSGTFNALGQETNCDHSTAPLQLNTDSMLTL